MDALEAGKPYEVAAAISGISPRAAWQWKREDEEFAEDTARARLVGASVLHDRVAGGDEKGAGFGPAKAALELLRRRFPKEYGDKVQIGVARELDKILDAVQGVCSPDDFERILARLAAIDSEDETGEDTGE